MSTELILRVEDVEVVYERVILGLRGISFHVPRGAVVALLGANGAGKTTALKAISNVVRAARGEVTAGRIWYEGGGIARRAPADLVADGLVQVLEGRHCFPHLTVDENLRMGGFVRGHSRAELRRELERVYQLFPRLRDRRNSRAGLTSGGEQQMVAIGRALMARPKLMLLDEPSMGLAPQIVEEIFDIVRGLNREHGVSVLVAEQNAAIALEYADHGFVLENGRVTSGGSAVELLARNDIWQSYLGGATPTTPAHGQPSGRDRPRRPQFAIFP